MVKINKQGQKQPDSTWWEIGQERISQPVMRVSNDNGQTFGPVAMLSANGTISTTANTTTTTTAGEEVEELINTLLCH